MRDQASSKSHIVERRVLGRTRGTGSGPIVRLMSPSDLGQYLKPFVFLDLAEADSSLATAGNVHPHSGIATVTVIPEGSLWFDKGDWGSGRLDYGGVEWMRAGSGIWHGDEFRPDVAPRFKAFQLWVALPADLEASAPEWQFVPAADIPVAGPARVIAGSYAGVRSPVRSFDGLNYLLVTLAPGERWTYRPPAGHLVAWLALSSGGLDARDEFCAGDMIIFDRSEDAIPLRAGSEGATFVLGSAVPHPHDLVLGHYSVHSSVDALRTGEARIEEIRPPSARIAFPRY